MSTPTTGSSTEATPTPPPEDRAEHGPDAGQGVGSGSTSAWRVT